MSANFNYIAFSDQEYIEGEINHIEMSRGRMFEHTPLDIGKKLESLEPTSLAFLESLPTFLCSEISRQDATFSMIVKYGQIEGITLDRREISTTFKTLIDFGSIEFAALEEARNIFGANRFQLYRTHWAVMDGDAQDILSKLAQYKPELADTIKAQLKPNLITLVEPPPLIKKTIGIANSVESFLELLYKFPVQKQTETFFRGHEDAQFELTPSLLRKKLDGAYQFMPYEDRLCKELLIAHYDEFQGDQYCFDRLVRMQHYGLPTRLLDISSNPLVALFFSCHSANNLSNIEGEVIIFRVRSDKLKYYDSDTVSCLANLSNLTYIQKNEIDLRLDVEAFNESSVAGKLLHHIKSEKGFFQARIVPDDLGSIVCVKAKQTNTRIKSQSGAFLLFGQNAALSESGQEDIEIARVTIVNKQHILEQLDKINVNSTTVYPSIDQTATHLRERYLLEPPI